ncbi:CocE/NonD family hydrolase [Sphingomonas sp. BIUV-7]|uniref:CocE/NonD family hydrolase n=1 Tax=Sphingomonas natans TaxID=3063330 RepID=A0ABT8YA72_9SPHN|nr:CocE/NonD family hydrolase [Sphingomonas sp. BIUV-7]MDO6415231.1 CocE/NonD family hydrolase [Sphingomonas sp. BIUV-7]
MRRLLVALALAFAGVSAARAEPVSSAPPPATTSAPSFGHYAPLEAFPEIVSHSLYLPMRDGVKIALRIDRPARGGKAADGRFPVIWHGALNIAPDPTRRGTEPGLRDLPNLAKYGYVVVQIARRGNGQSFGERRGYHDRNEAQDAYEITQWLAAQPWSDGKVGIYGCSNTGDAAMHAITVRPPALKAVFAGCFSWHKYDPFRRGGIFAQWGTGPSRTIAQDMDTVPVEGDADKTMLRQAAEEHQRSTNLLEMWKQLPYRDSFSSLVASRFWQEGSAADYADQIRRSGVALYILGGWYDELRDQGLIARMNVPDARILIGPWQHCTNDDFPLFEEVHRFFDAELKGIDTGFTSEPPIHYFTIGAPAATAWRTTTSWPLAGTRTERRFFGAGTLGERAGSAKPASFAVNYDVHCPTENDGPFAQPCHNAGAGVSFADKVLGANKEVTGHPVATVWMAADARDADVFAYLEDVALDGTVVVVTEGRLKASLRATTTAPWAMPTGVPWHRAFAEDAAPLTPGEPVKLDIDLMPTSYIFKAGHRVQLTITGADPRQRARDPGLAKTISVYADAAHPSAVDLPVIPR